MDDLAESQLDSQLEFQLESQEQVNFSLETPPEDVFVAPSIHTPSILAGESYSHFSPIPEALNVAEAPACVLGVDEAGRGPVLGPMVYGVFYLPADTEEDLLKDKHHFDDSKALTPAVRSSLMEMLCSSGSDLHQACGWATRIMSARDISANMVKPAGRYNLNAQAMDATVDLIHGVFERGVNIKHIYVDTIGKPEIYQKKLEHIFPTTKVTVAKKADSLYPCVSAASVCAKVTRDAALEVCYEPYLSGSDQSSVPGWGSGYPSDARCVAWLKSNMHPLFGWGPECRFSWGTAKDMLDKKSVALHADWPEEDDDNDLKVSSYFSSTDAPGHGQNELAGWFGGPVSNQVF